MNDNFSEYQKQSIPPQPQNGYDSKDESGIWEYLQIIRQRILLIILCVATITAATAFFTLRMKKIYRATTTIRIETQAPQVLGKAVEDVVKMGTGSFWSNIEYYETQYKIIESREIASTVVKKFKLNEDPVFMGIDLNKKGKFPEFSVDDASLVFQSMVTVEPVEDSRLVNVHVDNEDPKRAKLYVDTLARAYLDYNLQSMLQSTLDAVDWLSKQLDDARENLTTSEKNLYKYKKENDILSISLEDRQNIIASQMAALSTKLVEASAKRILAQAQKSAILKAKKNKSSLSIPLNVLNANTLIQALKQDYGMLSRERDELSKRYGPQYPKMKELAEKIKGIEKEIAREVGNILLAINAEVAAAITNEHGLKRALAEIKEKALALNQKEIFYKRLERDIDNHTNIYNMLLGRTKEADLSRLLRVNNAQILDSALLPEKPIKPRFRLNMLIAVVFGLIFGVGLAFLLEFIDRTIKYTEDVENLGLAFLGIIPAIDSSSVNSSKNAYGMYAKKSSDGKRKPKIKPGEISYDTFVHKFKKSQVAESLRAIRTNLLFMSADNPAKIILITSPSPQEGKTTVAVNLAITMAQSGSRVLVVDTDMRRPRIHKIFGMTSRTGISSLVLGESSFEEAIKNTEIPNLDILLCGPIPPNPSELIHTDSFKQIIKKLTTMYDRVILDSPPVGVVTDAAILSKTVDGTVLVLKSLQTTRDAGKHAVGVLHDIGATILGGVLNNLDLSSRKYGSHYYYYYNRKYGYYYGNRDSETDSESPDIPPSIGGGNGQPAIDA